eukprot:scaffold161988_cov34-Tisochrysis_lutea.AAC.7
MARILRLQMRASVNVIVAEMQPSKIPIKMIRSTEITSSKSRSYSVALARNSRCSLDSSSSNWNDS